MREIAMVPAGDGKHADVIEGDRDSYSSPTPAYPDDSQTHQMYGKEGDTANPVYLGWPLYFRVLKARPGVKPPQNGIPGIWGFGRVKRLRVGHTILLVGRGIGNVTVVGDREPGSQLS